MVNIDDEIMEFLKEVLFSDDAPRKIKENALELIIKDEIKGIKPFMVGQVLLSSNEYNRVKVAYENIDGTGPSKILAIKELRTISGLGLKHAKEAVEEWINSNCERKLNPILCK